MKPSEIVKAVKFCHLKGLVPMLLGQPGIGKSSILKQVADDQGIEFLDFRPALHSIEDLIGLPNFSDDKKTSSFATPDWLPTEGKGIFCIEELPQATPTMMAALSQFILDRKIGSYTLPEGWNIAVAGNRMSDRAATHKMPSHINDRMTFIDIDFDLNDFDNFCHAHKINTIIRAFVKFNPKIVTSFDPKLDINCTPRSLVQASNFIDAPYDIRYALIEGTIGEGPAAELLGYLEYWAEIPDIELIKETPTTVKISDSPGVKYGVSTMLSANVTTENFAAFLTYMTRMEPEFTISFVKDAIRINDDIAETEEFNTFLKDNVEVLI